MAGNDKVHSETFSFLDLYKGFCENTTMHGLGRAITTRSPCRRFVWSAMVLFVFGFAVFQFVAIVKDFYSYPVTTVVTLKHETKVTFPAITVCNLNRKKKSLANVELEGVLSEYLQDYNNIEAAPYDTLINAIMKSATMSEDVDDSGHQLSQMLIKCLFNRSPCSDANFTPVYTATYGTCYTFQTEDSLFKYATRPGPQNGLILEMNIEYPEYLSISSKAGVKVIVHARDEKPFPEDGGILAQPGAATSIAVKKVVTRRLPSPYSTCVSASGDGNSRLSLFSGNKYTQNACRKSCYQFSLYRGCNCCDVDLPCDYHTVDKMNGMTPNIDRILPYCNTSEELGCESVIEHMFLNGQLGCDDQCPTACDHTTFDTVVSSALWPSDSYFDAFLQKVIDTDLQNTSFNSSTSLKQFARSNLLRLDIFLDSLESLEFVTQPKYDWNMLLGNVGGQLGLWLGFSLLTAMELLELLMDTVFVCIRRRYQKKTTNNQNRIDDNHVDCTF